MMRFTVRRRRRRRRMVVERRRVRVHTHTHVPDRCTEGPGGAAAPCRGA